MAANHNCDSNLGSTRYLFFGDEKYLDECVGRSRGGDWFIATLGIFDEA
jgi:hypothetical protein